MSLSAGMLFLPSQDAILLRKHHHIFGTTFPKSSSHLHFLGCLEGWKHHKAWSQKPTNIPSGDWSWKSTPNGLAAYRTSACSFTGSSSSSSSSSAAWCKVLGPKNGSCRMRWIILACWTSNPQTSGSEKAKVRKKTCGEIRNQLFDAFLQDFSFLQDRWNLLDWLVISPCKTGSITRLPNHHREIFVVRCHHVIFVKFSKHIVYSPCHLSHDNKHLRIPYHACAVWFVAYSKEYPLYSWAVWSSS